MTPLGEFDVFFQLPCCCVSFRMLASVRNFERSWNLTKSFMAHMQKILLMAGVAGFIVLAGCSTPSPAPRQNLVDASLVEALDKIDHALIGMNKNASMPASSSAPTSNKNTMTVKWSGSAIGLLEAIILKLKHDNPNSKMELVVRGHPELPLPVSVDVKETPVDQLLGLIAAQIDQRADLYLEDQAFIIEYRVKVAKK